MTGFSEVAGERRLRVRPGGNEAEVALSAPLVAGLEKRLDRGGAVVLVRCRRPGQPRIVGEQRDDALDVAGGKDVDEASGEFALRSGVRRGSLAILFDRAPFDATRKESAPSR